MFKNRKITMKVEKINENQNEGERDPQAFENKVSLVTQKLQRLGASMFAGVCIYVILDTRRQVAVAREIYHPER